MGASQADLDLAAERLRKVLRLLHRRAQGPSSAEEPTRSEQAVLAWLEEQGPMSIGALAVAEHVRPQSIGQTVDALEQRGWAKRTRASPDRRQVVVSLTQAGQQALAIGRGLRQAWLVHALATRFTPAERAKLIDAISLLERVVNEEPAHSARPAGTADTATVPERASR
jgi:DNA-binding MarR family transcriptional regulator